MHVKTKVFSVRKRERVVYVERNGHVWSLQLCPPVTHNHSCQVSDGVISRRAGCNKATLWPMPVGFKEANGGMVKTKHH